MPAGGNTRRHRLYDASELTLIDQGLEEKLVFIYERQIEDLW
jgi:hypothetical protein